MYISRADTLPYTCGSNKFGFRFSTNLFSYSYPVPVNNFSHIYSNVIINDSLVWTKISGSFIADSTYKYFIIGNFYDDINTNTSGCISKGAYYYIDKICLSSDPMLCNVVSEIKKIDNYSSFNIYPNPIQNYINLSFSDYKKPYDVIIYNSFGIEIIRKKINSAFEQIDISIINDGILYLKIINDNNVLNYKLLKQNL